MRLRTKLLNAEVSLILLTTALGKFDPIRLHNSSYHHEVEAKNQFKKELIFRFDFD